GPRRPAPRRSRAPRPRARCRARTFRSWAASRSSVASAELAAPREAEVLSVRVLVPAARARRRTRVARRVRGFFAPYVRGHYQVGLWLPEVRYVSRHAPKQAAKRPTLL